MQQLCVSWTNKRETISCPEVDRGSLVCTVVLVISGSSVHKRVRQAVVSGKDW